ncbi:MAG: glycolate oxidase subunit GlcD [Deltaproteobacteria bacterium]|nr:MAG: glycolate oxidase subunit GlcD [Deltaproteobacteria bacterium]
MDKSVIKKIRDIVGNKNVLTSREDLVCYAYDASGIESLPDIVVFPGSAAEISAIVQLANRFNFPLFPRGAGSGNVGGAVPLGGGVVIALSCLDKIIEIDVENQYAVVEPGVITGEFQKAVSGKGLYYPPDPASLNFCTIGGNVATGAGGPRAVKYGVTYNYVLGLEVVLPTGEIINTGRKTVKGVVGYDLTSLFIGSEGTLGIITKIILRLIPKPEKKATLLVLFDNIGKCVGAVGEILKSHTLPSAIEFIDRNTIRAVESRFKMGFPENVEAILLIEVDGDSEIVELIKGKLVSVCKNYRAIKIDVALKEDEQEELWKVRRSIAPALLSLKPSKINEDVCVPRNRIPDLVMELERISAKYAVPVASFGHAGDGNLHVNFLLDRANTDELVRAERATQELFDVVLKLGGTLSGEHGIGIAKSPFMSMEVGDTGLKVMKSIKKALDPNNIMNPGKIFEPNWAFFRKSKNLTANSATRT